MNTETPLYRIPAANYADFTAKMAQLAKRAERLGVTAPTFTLVERVETIEEDHTATVTYLVSVDGLAPAYAGWHLTAVIELDHEEGRADGGPGEPSPNVVSVVPGETYDPAWRTLGERCDHCNVDNRNRAKLVVVTHTDGTQKIVGSTCLRDFLGHSSPEAIATWATYVATLDLDSFGEAPVYTEQRFELATYLAWTVRAITEGGWVPKSRSGFDRPATSGIAFDLWCFNAGWLRLPTGAERPADLTEAEIAKGALVAEWAKAQGGNDYLDNVGALAHKLSIRAKHFGIAASMVAAFDRANAREIEQAATAEATAASTHFGTVGERLDLEGVVTFVRFFDGDYGTRALVKLITTEGNVATWWCSNASKAPAQGDQVTGKATVKAHETFEGTAQTLITRAKLETAVAA